MLLAPLGRRGVVLLLPKMLLKRLMMLLPTELSTQLGWPRAYEESVRPLVEDRWLPHVVTEVPSLGKPVANAAGFAAACLCSYACPA